MKTGDDCFTRAVDEFSLASFEFIPITVVSNSDYSAIFDGYNSACGVVCSIVSTLALKRIRSAVFLFILECRVALESLIFN